MGRAWGLGQGSAMFEGRACDWRGVRVRLSSSHLGVGRDDRGLIRVNITVWTHRQRSGFTSVFATVLIVPVGTAMIAATTATYGPLIYSTQVV